MVFLIAFLIHIQLLELCDYPTLTIRLYQERMPLFNDLHTYRTIIYISQDINIYISQDPNKPFLKLKVE